MKLTTNPQDFMTESLLLLRSRPTARITTTYHSAVSGKGLLTLKTYDPVSGALVKFRTSKIADVGRLVAGLQRLGRSQANVSEEVEAVVLGGDVTMPDAPTPGTSTPVPGETPAPAAKASKKKKKKGKQ
ncbi:hypothetical protein RUND412_006109 [Rhizina undulata]